MRYENFTVSSDGFAGHLAEPEGFLGKMMLKGMNSGHAKMADWGMGALKGISPKMIAELDPRISVHTAIADGFTILEYPNFRHDLPKRIFSAVITGVEFFAFRHMGLFSRILGEDIDSMIYKKASWATIYNLEYSMMPYRYKYEAFNLADSYIWHGEKEPGLIHVLRKIDRSKYRFRHMIFKGKGHGSLLLEPKRLMREIERAYNGCSKDYIAK